MITLESLARHQKLTQMIVDEIKYSANQRISFARFMELALLAPSVGYYASSASIFGSRGDFVTAPEISSLWSLCLARYCAPILEALGTNGVTIIEIGGGTGRMAADFLLELERLGCLPNRYVIVEVSITLQKQQRGNLKKWVPHLISRIEHQAQLPCEPIEGIILANEVIDVLPVHRFLVSEGMVYEHYVAWDGDRFVWQKGKADDQLAERVHQIRSDYLTGVENYCSEVSLSLEIWFKELQACLKKGCILLMDYGRPQSEYYHPERTTGTLRCYYQHRCYEDPLVRVGLQDITSDVDFTQVANLAAQSALSVHAFVSQAAFLLGSGLLAKEKLCYDNPLYLRFKGQIHQLMAPSEMGELCKVMILGRNLSCDLLSLEEYDKRFSL